jgi:hypothetical protein
MFPQARPSCTYGVGRGLPATSQDVSIYRTRLRSLRIDQMLLTDEHDTAVANFSRYPRFTPVASALARKAGYLSITLEDPCPRSGGSHPPERHFPDGSVNCAERRLGRFPKSYESEPGNVYDRGGVGIMGSNWSFDPGRPIAIGHR